MQPRGQSEKPSSVPRAGLFAQPFCFRISIPPVSHQNCEKSKIMKLPVPVHPLLYADCTFKPNSLALGMNNVAGCALKPGQRKIIMFARSGVQYVRISANMLNYARVIARSDILTDYNRT